MTVEWTHWHSSKFAATCSYCKRDIHTSEGRWTAPKEGEKGRWSACHDCIAPPQAGTSSEPPPKPNGVPGTPPPLVDEKPPEPMESDAAKGHRENMESAAATREVMRNSLLALTNALNALEKELSVLVTAIREAKK